MDEAGTEIGLFLELPQRDAMMAGDPLPTDILELVNERANRYRIEADRDHILDGLRKAGLSV